MSHCKENIIFHRSQRRLPLKAATVPATTSLIFLSTLYILSVYKFIAIASVDMLVKLMNKTLIRASLLIN